MISVNSGSNSLCNLYWGSVSCDGCNRKRTYMLIDEEDRDVFTLCVLSECSLDSVNFRLWGNEYVPCLYVSEKIAIAY